MLDFIFLSGHKDNLHPFAHSPLTCHLHTGLCGPQTFSEVKFTVTTDVQFNHSGRAVLSYVQCFLSHKRSANLYQGIRVTNASKYPKLLVQVSLDGKVQESQESMVDGGLHEWHEPFSL